MSAHGILDKVAIVGMGCTPFGEHWAKSADDLIVDAAVEAMESAHIDKADVDAYWVATRASGASGLMLSRPLATDYRPVTRVENLCASASEALRSACYAVASGAYDVAMALGVEKLKDSGHAGLVPPRPPDDATEVVLSAPAPMSLLAPAYAAKYGLDVQEMRDAMTHVAWKNHVNGARNPRAQFRKEVSKQRIADAPTVAGMLGVLDCSGVSDGASAAIVVRAEEAARYTSHPLYVKALSVAAGPAKGVRDPNYDYTTFPEVVRSARAAYTQAGVTDPRTELAMAEVHDCFTPTELVLLEDLGISQRGNAWKETLAGCFDLDGDLPVNPDGGLKSFGHPIGASGLRMVFECWLQLGGIAPELRTIGMASRGLALTQNLGGAPGDCVSFVGIFGSELNE